MWLLNDFRDFNEVSNVLLQGMELVGSIGSIPLYKKVTTLSVYYALCDGTKLIAYYWLMAVRQYANTYKGHEFHVATEYQNKGIGTALYKHILLVDGYTVISDHYHTSISSIMWDKLQTMSEVEVGTYDEVLDTFDWTSSINKEMIYNNDYMHFVVRAKQ